MKTLTKTQKSLLEKISLYKYIKNHNGVFKYDDMKNICEFKSFDTTFNALLIKGYVKRVDSEDFSNKFSLS